MKKTILIFFIISMFLMTGFTATGMKVYGTVLEYPKGTPLSNTKVFLGSGLMPLSFISTTSNESGYYEFSNFQYVHKAWKIFRVFASRSGYEMMASTLVHGDDPAFEKKCDLWLAHIGSGHIYGVIQTKIGGLAIRDANVDLFCAGNLIQTISTSGTGRYEFSNINLGGNLIVRNNFCIIVNKIHFYQERYLFDIGLDGKFEIQKDFNLRLKIF